jgi:hypothetical protein
LWPTKKKIATAHANAVAGRSRRLNFSPVRSAINAKPAHDETPERIFERLWVLLMLDRVVEILRNEFVQHGRPEHFERSKVFLLDQSDTPYAAVAREMNPQKERSKWPFTGCASGTANSCDRKYWILWQIQKKWNPNSGIWLRC